MLFLFTSFPFSLFLLILPPIVLFPHHPFMLSPCILFLSFLSPVQLFLLSIIFLPPDIFSSCLLSLVSLSIWFPILFSLFFIIPSSYPPSFGQCQCCFDRVLNVVNFFFTFVAVGLQTRCNFTV